MKSDRMKHLPERAVFSLFFTAGYPKLGDTRVILKAAEEAGVDMVEIGFPFSDPVADGPTIQASNHVALANGMNVSVLFEQLRGMRTEVSIPVLLMGYVNPMLQYGVERFLTDASDAGVDAVIVPDMPFEEYRTLYAKSFERHRSKPVFLVTRRTDASRIREFDAAGPAFLYVVSSEATTGGKATVDTERDAFFKRLSDMKLKSRLIVGFGVADRSSFEAVTRHTSGAIVGSAFLRSLGLVVKGSDTQSDPEAIRANVRDFVAQYK
jgi:tryptophan synthase alpha chain